MSAVRKSKDTTAGSGENEEDSARQQAVILNQILGKSLVEL